MLMVNVAVKNGKPLTINRNTDSSLCFSLSISNCTGFTQKLKIKDL